MTLGHATSPRLQAAPPLGKPPPPLIEGWISKTGGGRKGARWRWRFAALYAPPTSQAAVDHAVRLDHATLVYFLSAELKERYQTFGEQTQQGQLRLDRIEQIERVRAKPCDVVNLICGDRTWNMRFQVGVSIDKTDEWVRLLHREVARAKEAVAQTHPRCRPGDAGADASDLVVHSARSSVPLPAPPVSDFMLSPASRHLARQADLRQAL